MAEVLLILNAGSSSLKFAVFPAARGEAVVRGQVKDLAGAPVFSAADGGGRGLVERALAKSGEGTAHERAVEQVMAWLAEHSAGNSRTVAAGHRVVHGGARFAKPVRIADEVLEAIDGLAHLAPLHQPPSLAVIRAVKRAAPGLPQVACFDTAFHRTQPDLARMIALPREFRESGVERYGFHGLSYEYICGVLPSLDARAARGRTVIAHLGNGASLCATLGGKSIATTMGFSALDGLVMGTRCGAIDPGVLLHLQRHHAISVDEVERLLYERSGLLGVSGMSGDMRVLLASDEPAARGAVDLFVYRAAREIGSLAAALGGMDALVFTGGIGENSAEVRAAICRSCEWLGVELDEAANRSGGPCITRAGGAAACWVIPTNEEAVIARHTMDVLSETEQPTT